MNAAEIAALSWTPLPTGNDIVLKQGFRYAALASVSKSYTTAQIQGAARSKGLRIEQWSEQGVGGSTLSDPNTDHRYIHTIVTATKDAGLLPWKSPWPTTIFSLVKAWYSAPNGALVGPPSAAPAANMLAVGLVATGASVVAGAWYYLYRRNKRR